MGSLLNWRFFQSAVLAPCSLVAGSAARGATQFHALRKPFYFDLAALSGSLDLPVVDKPETVAMSEQVMRLRLDGAPKDETVEPLTVVMGAREPEIASIVEKLALPGHAASVTAYLRQALKTAKPLPANSHLRTVVISRAAYELMDKPALADLYARTHHRLTVSGQDLQKDASLTKRLLAQLSPFFEPEARALLKGRIAHGEALSVDDTLLPDFARKMVRKYVIYRGPNCFHAALAFQSPKLTASSFINVKREAGYHRAMINYDELWSILNREFYEVNPEKQRLKYGDMLVFFDVPKGQEKSSATPIDYRWIRHTATYLFSGYTFSKGSKSPNTPYIVRTLSEEWKTWEKYTQHLGVKIFRRSQKTVRPLPPADEQDWIY